MSERQAAGRGRVRALPDPPPRASEPEASATDLALFAGLLETTPDLVWITRGSEVEFANRAAREFAGIAPDGDPSTFDPNDLLPAPARLILEHAGIELADQGRWSGELVLERHDRAAVPVSMLRIVDRRDPDGTEVVATLCRDLAAQRAHEAELSASLYTDEVTGLPNRRHFLEEARRATREARPQSRTVGVLVVGLDRFQVVNGTLGPAAGNRLLIGVADRIQSALGTDDLLVRLGGDEFGVLCERGEMKRLEVLGEDILAALARPFAVGTRELAVTASVGAVEASGHRGDPNALLQDATAAVYQAKEKGRGRVERFDEVRRLQTVARLELEQELRRALRRGELKVAYQPEVWLTTGDLVCLEALVRWTHPERGPISPEEFIPIAESTGLILPLGEWVTAEVCRQIRDWEAAGLEGMTVSINVSPHQLEAPTFVERFLSIVDTWGVLPHQINVEITESAMTEDSRLVRGRVQALRDAGFTLILDDFGSGYSSLSQLRNLPFSVLKIDKSFVVDMVERTSDRPLVDAVIRMAHALGRVVVAEGVETEEHAEILRELRCEIAQGWHFGRPVSGDEIAASLGVGEKPEDSQD